MNSQMNDAERNSEYSYKIHIMQYVYNANSNKRDDMKCYETIVNVRINIFIYSSSFM